MRSEREISCDPATTEPPRAPVQDPVGGPPKRDPDPTEPPEDDPRPGEPPRQDPQPGHPDPDEPAPSMIDPPAEDQPAEEILA
jgi:hypothetical protein